MAPAPPGRARRRYAREPGGPILASMASHARHRMLSSVMRGLSVRAAGSRRLLGAAQKAGTETRRERPKRPKAALLPCAEPGQCDESIAPASSTAASRPRATVSAIAALTPAWDEQREHRTGECDCRNRRRTRSCAHGRRRSRCSSVASAPPLFVRTPASASLRHARPASSLRSRWTTLASTEGARAGRVLPLQPWKVGSGQFAVDTWRRWPSAAWSLARE